MIERRHAWLLRDDATMYESVDTPAGSLRFGCKVCAVRGDTVRVPRSEFARHGAAHRREKVAGKDHAEDFIGQTELVA